MKLSNRKLLSIAIGLIGLVWCCCVCAAAVSFDPPLRLAGGLTFGILAAVLSVVYLIVFKRYPGSSAVETGALSVFFTIIYFAAALLANTVFIFCGRGEFNRFLVCANLLINVIFVILVLYAEKDTRRLTDQLERTAEKTAARGNLSVILGELLAEAKDEQVRAALYRLKEAVDYSSNITTAGTADYEEQMEALLTDLKDLIANGGSPEETLSGIREAESLWKSRNSAAAAGR